MKQRSRLNISDTVTLPYALLMTAFAASWAGMTGWARGPDTPKRYGVHVLYSALRVLVDRVAIRQGQALNGTTRDQYARFAKSSKIEPSIVEIEDGLFGCWVGEHSASTTLLWFHGGGYVYPATPEHFAFLLDIVNKAREKGRSLRVLMLEYELAPHGVYPTQLRQAVAAVKYLVESGVQPSQIILGGDSAGGNLAAGLLLHMTHPRAEVAELTLSTNVAGALFVSPWVTFQTDSAAFTRHIKEDMITKTALTCWSNAFMGDSPRDHHSHPIDAPAEWWSEVKVDSLAFVAGATELFVDDIRNLVEKVKIHRPDVEYLEAANESHDPILTNRAFGLKQELASEKFIQEWVLARLV